MPKRRTIVTTVAILFLLIAACMLWLTQSKPNLPKVTLNLWDGSQMTLIEADHGRNLCFFGGTWQRMLSKAIGHDLPTFVRNRPELVKSAYTNGLALVFRREESHPGMLAKVWNRTGDI